MPSSCKALPEAGLRILKGEVRGAIWGSGSCGKAVDHTTHAVHAVTLHPQWVGTEVPAQEGTEIPLSWVCGCMERGFEREEYGARQVRENGGLHKEGALCAHNHLGSRRRTYWARDRQPFPLQLRQIEERRIRLCRHVLATCKTRVQSAYNSGGTRRRWRSTFQGHMNGRRLSDRKPSNGWSYL